MSDTTAYRWSDIAWGPPCADGLSVGLSVPVRKFKQRDHVAWRWALRSTSGRSRRVVIEHDMDTRFRYCLEVFRSGDTLPAREFPSSRNPLPTTSGATRTVELVNDMPVDVETNEVRIGAELGAGVFRLRVRFGGPGFDFFCVSEAVQIVVE